MAKASEKSVERVVSAKQLIALIEESTNVKSKTSEISGALGERIKNAIENGHLHRQAFSVVAKMHRMEELKREHFIRQLWLYVDMCRANGLFKPEHVGDLAEMAAGREGDDEGEHQASYDDSCGPPGQDDAPPPQKLADAAARVAHASGIKPLKPRKGALDGADAPSGTRIQ